MCVQLSLAIAWSSALWSKMQNIFCIIEACRRVSRSKIYTIRKPILWNSHVNVNETKWKEKWTQIRQSERKNNIIIQQNKAAEREDIRWLDMRTRKQDAQTHHLYGVSNILDVWNHNEKLAQCVHRFVFLKAQKVTVLKGTTQWWKRT